MNKIELIKYAIKSGAKYDKDTGTIFGLSGRAIKRMSYGYIDFAILIDGKCHHIPGHQFAFYFEYGFLPEIIDHIDRNRSNNKISNLRQASKLMNNRNRTAKGYYLHNQTGKYCAQITVNYRHIHLGCFDTIDEATLAYNDAKAKYHYPKDACSTVVLTRLCASVISDSRT
jgi:hypothetical protein